MAQNKKRLIPGETVLDDSYTVQLANGKQIKVYVVYGNLVYRKSDNKRIGRLPDETYRRLITDFFTNNKDNFKNYLVPSVDEFLEATASVTPKPIVSNKVSDEELERIKKEIEKKKEETSEVEIPESEPEEPEKEQPVKSNPIANFFKKKPAEQKPESNEQPVQEEERVQNDSIKEEAVKQDEVHTEPVKEEPAKEAEENQPRELTSDNKSNTAPAEEEKEVSQYPKEDASESRIPTSKDNATHKSQSEDKKEVSKQEPTPSDAKPEVSTQKQDLVIPPVPVKKEKPQDTVKQEEPKLVIPEVKKIEPANPEPTASTEEKKIVIEKKEPEVILQQPQQPQFTQQNEPPLVRLLSDEEYNELYKHDSKRSNKLPTMYRKKLKTMKIITIISVILVIGMALALFNVIPVSQYLNGEKQIVVLATDLEAGDIISADDLKMATITASEYDALSTGTTVDQNGNATTDYVVLWSNRAGVTGKFATKNLTAGDYLYTGNYTNLKEGMNMIEIDVNGEKVKVPVSATQGNDTSVNFYAIVITNNSDGTKESYAIDMGKLNLQGKSLTEAINSSGDEILNLLNEETEEVEETAEPSEEETASPEE